MCLQDFYVFLILYVSAIMCPTALSPANGKTVCSSSNHTFQTICSTYCKNGHTAVHEHTECQSDGQWSHGLPACIGTALIHVAIL
jgi:hypothetical protein